MTVLDTSAAMALLVADHEAHERTVGQIPSGPVGLSGHALFETYSVLTRLPVHRVTPGVAARLLADNFGRSVEYQATVADLIEMAQAGISGGQVYDALIGLAARSAHRTLLTRDGRAMPTYLAMGADAVLLN